jgi:uncharacterized membrane protein (DUF2068 family)
MRRPTVRAKDDATARAERRQSNLGGWFGVELRFVALIEFTKGALVLVAGAGLLAFAHRDLQEVLEELLLHLHLNPASRIPGIFVAAVEQVASYDLWLLATGAAAYATVRIAEGYGLWYDRAWAEWLGAISGLIYVPFELYALSKGITLLRVATLALNLLVVAVLIDALLRRRRR